VNPSNYLWLLFVPLMVFAIYRRLRRTFGQQEVRERRMVFRIVMLTVAAGVFVVMSPTAACLGAAAGGAGVGVALGLLGLVYTQYDVNEGGRFYRSNGWINIAVTALFLSRMIARLGTISVASATTPGFPSPFSGVQRSPLTVGIFLVMASFYVSYYAGVLRRVRRIADSSLPSPASR
jgi:hypothetical protein